ncbi:MAG TPA: NifB/NifX family molybdenum-iron cluster-binding protein [Phycisphaerae bacterium]|nr:hypothetical protein [Phycisphaerae bacterium]HOJ56191.1 NifB/NifX family molybdenum-iron cluster-binding protein [Phycisphaerae bacterium]HOL28083.1 NifB/NifX family molybdenum-iron cluster-binding protein [Phycisphaerae bacterium]HPP22441.1 NifB/NifX family molybdenum-iron cluster-binding protein [Phycisphaerae bacterium]HPU34580.1 NifB/NifX family molybdenum-iron cluster-binding protein [Phycisphaerae bacterium]
MAIPQWHGRVSPVFDVAANLLLIEVAGAAENDRREIALTSQDPTRRARQVAELAVNVLICGAISWPLELALRSRGIEVISQICGPVGEVVQSFLLGKLADGAFRMPGCCGRRRRGRPGNDHRCRKGQAEAPRPTRCRRRRNRGGT